MYQPSEMCCSICVQTYSPYLRTVGGGNLPELFQSCRLLGTDANRPNFSQTPLFAAVLFRTNRWLFLITFGNGSQKTPKNLAYKNKGFCYSYDQLEKALLILCTARLVCSQERTRQLASPLRK